MGDEPNLLRRADANPRVKSAVHEEKQTDEKNSRVFQVRNLEFKQMDKSIRKQNRPNCRAKTDQVGGEHEQSHLPAAILHPKQFGVTSLDICPSGKRNGRRRHPIPALAPSPKISAVNESGSSAYPQRACLTQTLSLS